MRLEKWGIIYGSMLNGYQAPELQTYKISGIVYGHSYFEDGTLIATSSIMKIKDGVAFTRTGSQYKLGKVDAEYLELYPDAEKLLVGTQSNLGMRLLDIVDKKGK